MSGLFYQKNDEDFIKAIYLACLGREPDKGGYDHYMDELRSGKSRASILKEFIKNDSKLNFNAVWYLKQNPDVAAAGVDPLEHYLQHGNKEGRHPAFDSDWYLNHVQSEDYPLDSCKLTPKKLSSFLYPDNKLAVFGTCVAESFVNVANQNGRSVAHYLCETRINSPVPNIDWVNFDAAVIHVTLRHILDEILGGWSSGSDLFHTRSGVDYDVVTSEARKILEMWLKKIIDAIGGYKPLFFLSFIEPIITTKGVLSNNRKQNFYRVVRDLNDHMADYLQGIDGAYYIELNDIVRYFGDNNCYDAYITHFSHAGLHGEISNRVCSSLFSRIDGAIKTLKNVEPIKIIITDLDNTIWNGIPAEEDEIIPYVHREGWPLGYVEALLECKRRGILLAICSKNNDSTTIEIFKKIWGDALKIDDFCVYKINWERKSKNVREILSEVNLLPENTLFIDDNPMEINEVKQAFPQIRTLCVPQQNWRNVLYYSPETQVVKITEESTQRTELIQAKLQRDASVGSMSNGDYLNSLGLSALMLKISNASHAKYVRALELLNKTNQFNTTGRRWTSEELTQWFSSGGVMFVIDIDDRFAKQGTVGVALTKDFTIEQVAISCRVFNLGIDQALFAYCIDCLTGGALNTCNAVMVSFSDTLKNASAKSFLDNFGFQWLDEGKLFMHKTEVIWPRWINLSPAS